MPVLYAVKANGTLSDSNHHRDAFIDTADINPTYKGEGSSEYQCPAIIPSCRPNLGWSRGMV